MGMFKQYAEQLVKAGKAYYCFCTEERLNEMHEAQRAAGEMTHYDGHCRHLSAEEIAAKLAAGEPYVIRQRSPKAAWRALTMLSTAISRSMSGSWTTRF